MALMPWLEGWRGHEEWEPPCSANALAALARAHMHARDGRPIATRACRPVRMCAQTQRVGERRPPGSMDEATVAREVDELVMQIRALGSRGADGKWSVPFGVLFDATTEIFEALAGTLKAAKKRGRIDYAAPILLKGKCAR